MYLFHVLCAVLCVTSVLTLSTKKEKKLDREIESANNSSSTTIENILDPKSQNVNKISADKKVPPEKMKFKDSKLNSPTMEGGGIFTDATVPLSIEKVPISPMNSSQELSSSISNSIKTGVQAERAVSPRKEAPPFEQRRTSIKPRKGVGNQTTFNETDSSSEDSNSKLNTQLSSSYVPPSSSNQTIKNTTIQKSETESTPTIKNAPPNKSVTETLQKISTEKVKKHKLKPTVTIGGSNVDAPIPASPTKTLPLGMPRKIDYIVPIMITIFVLPLLGVATYVLYRRGRDCWDKRHYRRMDFLIDGMYNE